MIPEKRLTKHIAIPHGVDVTIGDVLAVKGPKGEIVKELNFPTVEIVREGNDIVVKPKKCTKKEKTIINTFTAHLKNIMKGVMQGYTYKLKICSGHFPMSVAIDGTNVVVKNFLGEKLARKAKIVKGTKVEIKGDEVLVTSCNKEDAGQTAANIEQSCRITNRCRTRFQDGIWITDKSGKVM